MISFFEPKVKRERGTVLLFAIFILSMLFAIGTGMTLVIIRGSKISQGSGDSFLARSAAETGIEKILLDSSPSNIPKTFLDNGSSYYIEVTDDGDEKPDGVDCNAPVYCIQSFGEFGRSIQIVEIVI